MLRQLKSMDAEQASQVLQRLQVGEQAATEQLNARRGAERALVEAQAETGCIEMASVDLNALKMCCGRLSDARHARQSEELQTGV